MGFLVVVFLIIVFSVSPSVFICMVSNVVPAVLYAIKDIFLYFKYHKSRLVRTGEIIGYTGLKESVIIWE